jgi:hypothetical protein
LLFYRRVEATIIDLLYLGLDFYVRIFHFLRSCHFSHKAFRATPKIVGNGWLSVDRSKIRNVDGSMVRAPERLNQD